MTRLWTNIYQWTKYKPKKVGDDCLQEEIIGTAYLAAAYLEEVCFDKSKMVYVVGSTGITQELDDVGINYLPIGVRHLFSNVMLVLKVNFKFLKGGFLPIFWVRYDCTWA